jgi:cytochrome c oxidase subunit III
MSRNPAEHGVAERHHPPPTVHWDAARAEGAVKLGVWTFLATELLLFGALFTAYAVFRAKFPEMFHESHRELNRVLGAANTVVLITSSLTVALGVASIKRGRQGLLKLFLALTILLASGFLVIKYFEYADKFQHGIHPATNLFFALYFIMTGLHGIHVFGGIVVLGIMLVLAALGKFTAESNGPVEMAGLYWHFVDLIWIYLFPLLYLIG